MHDLRRIAEEESGLDLSGKDGFWFGHTEANDSLRVLCLLRLADELENKLINQKQ
jgi:hypothetical protein